MEKEFVGFDVETHLIVDGSATPRLVCLQVYREGDYVVYGRDKALGVFWELVQDPNVVLVGHYTPFDMGVLVREDPYLLEAIFNNAVPVGEKFVCTKVNEQLIRIALNVPLQGLRLSDLVKKYLGEDISETKGLDGWRMRYHLLDGVPVSDWPDEALKYAGLDAEYALIVLQQQRKHYGQYLADAPSQMEASWALHLMRNWGMRVDPVSVYALRKSIVGKVKASDETGTRLGIVRPNGTRDMGALRGLVKRAYRYIGKIPTTPKGAVSTSGETLLASRDPDLIAFAQGAPARKLLTTYVPLLERGIGAPINAFFNVLVRSGRTSCFKPNLQNLPRQHGVRETFIPRPNMTFCTVDYDTIELRALAQVHLNWFGQSALAEAFIEGEDPHLSLAAHFLDISYEEALAKKASAEVQRMRGLGKICNFGYAGGLSAAVWVSYAKGYGVELPTDEKKAIRLAEKLRKDWFNKWIEMKRYFTEIGKMTRSGEATIVQEYSGRVRGGTSFCSAANTFFQGLTADGCKKSLVAFTKACYLAKPGDTLWNVRPVIFLHDEVIAEGPKETAHLWSSEMQRIMVDVMGGVLPDVPVSAEAILMDRWYKNAQPSFSPVTGRLIPWKPDSAIEILMSSTTSAQSTPESELVV